MAEQEYEIRNKHMLVVAAGLGLVAVLLFLWHDYRNRKANEEGMIEVICVKSAVEDGKPLTDDNLVITRIPERLVPAEFMDDVARARDWKSLLNLEVTQDIAAGRIVRYSYLRGGPIRLGSPVLPKKGFRVMPIDVDDKTCPPSVTTGVYVDLMTTSNFDGKLKTIPVMEKVLVKTINGTGTPGSINRRINQVGLEVKKEDAVKLKTFMAARPSSIELWLRAADEDPKDRGFSPAVEADLKKKGIEFPKGSD